MQAKEFWGELFTEESWKKLQEISKRFDFVLIGGWAAFLHTKMHKSKDIDIIVDFNALERLKKEFRLEKNERLKKFEAKLEKFDIDIYVPFFSEFPIPPKELMEKHSLRIQGIKTLTAEALLLLKQNAEIERKNSIKGQKDAIDIIALLAFSCIDLKKYLGLLKKYKKEHFAKELKRVLQQFDAKDSAYLGMNFNEFQRFRKAKLKEIAELK